ncbi:class I SAM-dependent methyltransferase [Nocardioides daphniae]|uniref:Methyltransferase domain-containing protein n=1 Tax=Nocardioides daphniae TaxID=402297 RepID=A0A4P7UC99_9ACTN|nr:class I SAM-dependent methyltransferase [Nocardioides daphniae]QCC77823.1 hypothetical protein E2C04_12700 [Nocardioides daphniae]GGD27969.1 hypothetical protein GCM10007231_29330 [Nocardioides daphniae]
MEKTAGRRVQRLDVDDRGVAFSASEDAPVDVLFGGKRVFSFWLLRDTEGRGAQRLMPWPPVLRKFLDGTVDVALADPATGEELASTTAVLGSGEGEVRVVDADGNPMGLDKSMRLSRLFGDQDSDQTAPLLDSMETVIEVLEAAGVKPFVAYGTLLGAVRQGDFIGHDSDADLGYVSAATTPVDAIVESMQLQRRIERMGYPVDRYSGMGFKVSVAEADGTRRGLDVFGGFMLDDTLYLMGEVGAPFRREWLYPRSEVTLAGRTFPSPAEPDHLLVAMYGPSWRVPDPAFKFTTPDSTHRRLNGWFRGMRSGLDERWTAHREGRRTGTGAKPSALARHVAAQHPDAGLVVDLGCGAGGDTRWFSAQGFRAVGLDHFPPSLRMAMRQTEAKGLDTEFMWCNFGDLRSTLATGADLVRRPGPRVLMAHHLLDGATPLAREGVLRIAKMLARDTGTLYLQYCTAQTDFAEERGLRALATEDVRALVEAVGGKVVDLTRLTEEQAGFAGGAAAAVVSIDRMAVSWTR